MQTVDPRDDLTEEPPPPFGRTQATERSTHTHVPECVCRNARQLQSSLRTNIGSVFVAWPCFVSHNFWLKYYYSGHLHLKSAGPCAVAGTPSASPAGQGLGGRGREGLEQGAHATPPPLRRNAPPAERRGRLTARHFSHKRTLPRLRGPAPPHGTTAQHAPPRTTAHFAAIAHAPHPTHPTATAAPHRPPQHHPRSWAPTPPAHDCGTNEHNAGSARRTPRQLDCQPQRIGPLL